MVDNRRYPILLKEGEEPLIEKVAECIGCVNGEMCPHWEWRRCQECIDQAKRVVEIVKENIDHDNN